jgi:26S proteasome regulatory subunit N13
LAQVVTVIANTLSRANLSGMDANSIIQNFIQSMRGASDGPSDPQGKLFTTLADLLTPASTLPLIESADQDTVDQLLQYLPLDLVNIALEADAVASMTFGTEPTETSTSEANLEQKKIVLRKVLHSPQFSQSLSSLTIALRDGGLPSISEALNIPVRNGGYMRRGGVPLGGGEAVEAFLNGVKHAVNKDSDHKGDHMETE